MSSKNKKGKKRKKNKFKFVQDVSNIERDDEPFREVFMDEDEKDEPEEEEIELLDLDEDDIVEEIKNNASASDESVQEESKEFDESLSLIDDNKSDSDIDEIDFLDRTTNLDEIDFLDRTNSLDITYDDKNEEEKQDKVFNVFSDNIFDDDNSNHNSYEEENTSRDE